MLNEISHQSDGVQTLTVAERQPESISVPSCAAYLQIHKLSFKPTAIAQILTHTKKDIEHSHIHRVETPAVAQINKITDAQSAETN